MEPALCQLYRHTIVPYCRGLHAGLRAVAACHTVSVSCVACRVNVA